MLIILLLLLYSILYILHLLLLAKYILFFHLLLLGLLFHFLIILFFSHLLFLSMHMYYLLLQIFLFCFELHLYILFLSYFYFFLFKSSGEEDIEPVIRSFRSIPVEGTAVYSKKFEVKIPSHWTKETRACYDRLCSRTDTPWGIYCADLLHKGMDETMPRLEAEMEDRFELVSQYVHYSHDFTLELARKVHDSGRLFQMSYQYTTSNNTHLEGYTPVLDIYRGECDEVLRNYAEAVFERDGQISDEDLAISLNLTRKRINPEMPDLTNDFVTANNLDMRTEIRRERTIEFFDENFRIDDLKRWKTAEDEMPMNLTGVKWKGTDFENRWPDASFKEKDGEGCIIHEKGRNWHEKHYLLPLPTDQLKLNSNLKQNPGWNQ